MQRQELMDRLVMAKLAGQKLGTATTGRYTFNTNEAAASLALGIFALWLAMQAKELLSAAATNEDAAGRAIQVAAAGTINDLAMELSS